MTNHLLLGALMLLTLNAYALLTIALEVGVSVTNLTPLLGVFVVIPLVAYGLRDTKPTEVAQ